MLDITLLRKDLDGVIARLETRKKPQAFLNVDAFKALEAERKTLQTRTEELQSQRNSLSKQIGQRKAKGESTDDIMAAVAAIKTELDSSAARLDALQPELTALLLALDTFAAPLTTPLPMEWQIKLHVTVALLAFSVLSIAAVLAILLAVQERALRHRQFGLWLRALPPLTLTETLLFRLIGAGCAGFTFFTTGASGMLRCDLFSAWVGSLRGVPRW